MLLQGHFRELWGVGLGVILGLAIFDTTRELDTNMTRENRVWVLYNRVWVIIGYNRVWRVNPPDTIMSYEKQPISFVIHWFCSVNSQITISRITILTWEGENARETQREGPSGRERDETRRGSVKVTPRPTLRRLISFSSLRQKLQSHHPFLQPILLFYHFFTFLLSYPFLSLIPTGEDRDCRRRGNQDLIFRWINAGEVEGDFWPFEVISGDSTENYPFDDFRWVSQKLLRVISCNWLSDKFWSIFVLFDYGFMGM